MGKRKTWYVSDHVDTMLHDIKAENNFNNMNQVFDLLISNYGEKSLMKFSSESKNVDTKLDMIEENISILIELISWRCDKTVTIPEISVKAGFSEAYNNAKQIVEQNKNY